MRAAPLILALIVLTAAAGCGNPKPSEIHPSSTAHQKLIQILQQENHLQIVTKEFKHTLWIYLPLQESFFEFKASAPKAAPATGPGLTPTLNHVEGAYHEKAFTIDYDIALTRSYKKDYGYTTGYSGDYQKYQSNISSAIFRSYAEDKDAPDFFVIVIADVKNGIEIKNTIYLKDLMRVYQDPSFHEEYARRSVTDYPAGNPSIKDDMEGKHLDYAELTLGEFLSKQMVYRTLFKYTRSSFPPSEDARQELLEIAATTIESYGFTDFTALRLRDLATDTVETFSPEQLKTFTGAQDPSTPGRLINIKFQ